MPIVRADEVPRVSPTACLFEGEEHGVGISAFIVDSTPGLGPSLHVHPYAEVFVGRTDSRTPAPAGCS